MERCTVIFPVGKYPSVKVRAESGDEFNVWEEWVSFPLTDLKKGDTLLVDKAGKRATRVAAVSGSGAPVVSTHAMPSIEAIADAQRALFEASIDPLFQLVYMARLITGGYVNIALSLPEKAAAVAVNASAQSEVAGVDTPSPF